MALTTPTNLTILPTPPSQGDVANFATRADYFVLALQPLQTEFNAQNTIVYNNAIYSYDQAIVSLGHSNTSLGHSNTALGWANAAATSASDANISAINAASSAGAPKWLSGSTYALGAPVWSPINRVVYRKITASSVTSIDPSSDPTNWAMLGTIGLTVVIVSTTTVVGIAGGHYILTNGGTTTVTLPVAPIEGDTIWVTVNNSLYTNIINPNGESIMGVFENMIIDNKNATVALRYVNSNWRLI